MVKALILDNDAAVRKLLQLALEQGGIQTFTARTLGEMETQMREDPADVFLVDLHLGGGTSGVSVVKSLDEKKLLRPFLIVTGTPDHPSLKEVQGFHAFRGIVAKPFSIVDLVEQVKNIQ